MLIDRSLFSQWKYLGPETAVRNGELSSAKLTEGEMTRSQSSQIANGRQLRSFFQFYLPDGYHTRPELRHSKDDAVGSLASGRRGGEVVAISSRRVAQTRDVRIRGYMPENERLFTPHANSAIGGYLDFVCHSKDLDLPENYKPAPKSSHPV